MATKTSGGDGADYKIIPPALPLNRFTFNTGTAPTLLAFETSIGFPLLNGTLVNDVIGFDNVGYSIPDNVFQGNTNLTNVVSKATIIGNICFQNCTSLTNADFSNLITTTGNACFEGCISLSNVNFSSLITAVDNCFYGCILLVNPNFSSLITAGVQCFTNCTSLTNPNFNSLITINLGCFANCTLFITMNFANVDNFGTTTSANFIFNGIAGLTITVTAKTIHQTSNAGGLEGDLAYLDANNTVTFIWV